MWSNNVAIALNESSINVVYDGSYYSGNKQNTVWEDVLEAYRTYDILALISAINPVKSHTKVCETVFTGMDNVIVDEVSGNVTIDDIQVHGVILSRLLFCVKNRIPMDYLINFIRKLRQNPSKTAVDELFLFLESSITPMPITPNGNFLAYKKVNKDYTDCHTGTIDNSVGKTVEMPRNEVDDDRNRTCSAGLHFCSLDYTSSFGGARTIIVEINPADVVAIPSDYNNAKGRTWKYRVIGEHVTNLGTGSSVRKEEVAPVMKKEFVTEEDIQKSEDISGTEKLTFDWTISNNTSDVTVTNEGVVKKVVNELSKPHDNTYVPFNTRKIARDFAEAKGGKVLDAENPYNYKELSVNAANFDNLKRWWVKTAY